jgi:phosphate/sulfate permease
MLVLGRSFRHLQPLSAAGYSPGHGTNDVSTTHTITGGISALVYLPVRIL